jgi:hypothetical protein
VSGSESDRFPSAVRLIHKDTAPISVDPTSKPEAPAASSFAGSESSQESSFGRRVTTRLRMQRVTLMPFVPASLSGYVERVRERRRLKWVLAAFAVVVPAMVWFVWQSHGPSTARPPFVDHSDPGQPARTVAPSAIETARPFLVEREPLPVTPAPAASEIPEPKRSPAARSKPREGNSGQAAPSRPTPPLEKSPHEVPAKHPSSVETAPTPSSSWWY